MTSPRESRRQCAWQDPVPLRAWSSRNERQSDSVSVFLVQLSNVYILFFSWLHPLACSVSAPASVKSVFLFPHPHGELLDPLGSRTQTGTRDHFTKIPFTWKHSFEIPHLILKGRTSKIHLLTGVADAKT